MFFKKKCKYSNSIIKKCKVSNKKIIELYNINPQIDYFLYSKNVLLNLAYCPQKFFNLLIIYIIATP